MNNTCILCPNEEKTNDYENFDKGMIYMKILKKRGGVVEKRGEEETKSMPHAPVISASPTQARDTVEPIKHRLVFPSNKHFISFFTISFSFITYPIQMETI